MASKTELYQKEIKVMQKYDINNTLSIIRKIARKISKETKIKIYKKDIENENEIIIIKGKLGQYIIKFKNENGGIDKSLEQEQEKHFIYEKGTIKDKFIEQKKDISHYVHLKRGIEIIENEMNITEGETNYIENENELNIIKKILKGITQGYTINLESKGVGYQAKIIEENNIEVAKKEKIIDESPILEKNIIKRIRNINIEVPIIYGFIDLSKILSLQIYVGFSHNILYNLKDKDIRINTIQRELVALKIIGIEKNEVNRIASEISRIKEPEPYKGKGIRYKGVGKKYIEKKTQRTTKKKAQGEEKKRKKKK